MLRNYLITSLKVLLRRKFFTFISLFAIAFTLVTLMVAVALLDHTLGPQMPEINRDRTLILNRVSLIGPNAFYRSSAGYRLLDRYLRDIPGVEQLSIVSESPAPVNAYFEDQKLEIQMRRVDGEFWEVMKFDFLEGVPFTQDDDRLRRNVAVISQTIRNKYFGKNSAVGKTIRINGRSFRIVGTVADVPAYRIIPFAEIWVPIGSSKSDDFRDQLAGSFMGLFVKSEEADSVGVRDALSVRLQEIEPPDRRFTHIDASLETAIDSITGRFGMSSGMFFALFAFLMILFMGLPALNLANLNLSRILERRSEIGVRKAFGATSSCLAGQFIFENLVLTLLGGMIGLLGTMLILEAIEKSGLVPYASFSINIRIFLLSLLITLFFGLLSGAYPAWKMSKLNPAVAISGGVR